MFGLYQLWSIDVGSGIMIQFHVLSFEGPDAYACAGGLASRISGLTTALAEQGFDTHLWFIGDPDLPGREANGRLQLHRWCQWISRYHRGGVYDGEEGKRADFASSLPPLLVCEVLLPYLQDRENHCIIVAEEWHTVDAILYLDWLLRRAGMRDRVTMLWNALVLQSNDPCEFVNLFSRVQADPAEDRAIRLHGKQTAQQYAWAHIIRRNFLPRLQLGAATLS